MTINQLQEVKDKLISFEAKTKSSNSVSPQEAEGMLTYLESEASLIFRVAQQNIQTYLEAGTDARALTTSLVEDNEVYSRVHAWYMTKLDQDVQRLCLTTASKINLNEIRDLRNQVDRLSRCSPSKSQINQLNKLKGQLEQKQLERQLPAYAFDAPPTPLIPLGSSIYRFPNEIVEVIVGYWGKLGSIVMMNRESQALTDDFLAHYWRKLKQSPPPGLVDITELMTWIEQQFPNKMVLIWFKELQKEFASLGAIPSEGRLSLTAADFEVFEKQVEKKCYDDALVAIWGKIKTQYSYLNLPDLNNAEEIKQWLNHPANAVSLNQMTHLDLGHLDLRVLPSEIRNLTQLQTFNLEDNKLITLPESIGNLTQLRELYLMNNKLISIPDCIGNLTQLLILALEGNHLSSIPNSIGYLTQLQLFDLTNNKLAALPVSIGNLVSLRELLLDENNLINLPDSIGNLTQLHTLSLHKNKLICLPDSIGNLMRLLRLTIDENRLMFIPDAVIRSGNNVIRNNNVIANHAYELAYPSKSGLGKLYQLIIQRKDIEQIKAFFSSLPSEDKNLIFEMIWDLAGRMQTEDAQWGEHHAFEDMTRFYLAVRQSIFAKLEHLIPPHFIKLCELLKQKKDQAQIKILFSSLAPRDKNLIYWIIWDVSGRPPEDPQWGEHHVFDDMNRFYWAVRVKAISIKLECLPQDLKNQVHRYLFPGRGDKHQALYVLPQLADAMANLT